MTTRRFLNVLIADTHFVVRCRRSRFLTIPSETSKLFCQLLDSIERYSYFEVDDLTGQALTFEECLGRQNMKLHELQTCAYNKHRESLRELTFSSTGSLGDPVILLKHLELLSIEELWNFALELGIISDSDVSRLGEPSALNVDLQSYLFDLFSYEFKMRQVRYFHGFEYALYFVCSFLVLVDMRSKCNMICYRASWKHSIKCHCIPTRNFFGMRIRFQVATPTGAKRLWLCQNLIFSI